MTTTRAFSTVTDVAQRVVELAGLAPSVHNTQPWWWRLGHNTLELHADRDRQLRTADPQGRTLVISCGAALHQAELAAAALGWPAEVDRLPEGDPPGPLAVLRLHPRAPSPTAEQDLRLLVERRTDRRRFTSWPVPRERLTELADLSLQHGVRTAVLDDLSDRFRVNLLLSRAHALQTRDPQVRQELARWLDHSGDGVPQVPPSDDAERALGDTDALLVLTTPADDARAWLSTGEAMSALWLAAHADGLSVVPLSQAAEVAETRAGLQHELLGTLAVPQLLLRVGWQPIGRSTLPRTPRRRVVDVIRP